MKTKTIIAILLITIATVKKFQVGYQETDLDKTKRLLKGTWKSTKESDDGIHTLWKLDGTYLWFATTQDGDGFSSNEELKEKYVVGNSCASTSPNQNNSLEPNTFYISFLDESTCFIIKVNNTYLEVFNTSSGKYTSFQRQ